jgi:hypothetical protein
MIKKSLISLKNLLPSFEVYQEKRLAAYLEHREAKLAKWEEELNKWEYLESAKHECGKIVDVVRIDICEAIQQGESRLEIVLPNRFDKTREKIYKIIYLTLEKEFVKEKWYLGLDLPKRTDEGAILSFCHHQELLFVKRDLIDTKRQIKKYLDY